MSRSTTLKKELFSGTHLVAITKVSQGEVTDIIIRFSDGANKHFDKVYDYTGSEFLKMANSAGLLKNNAVFSSKEALGARLWLCIKEVWDVKGTEMLDTVNFYVFDTRPCIDPEKKPIIKGDPADNKGVPSGVFYDCRQVMSTKDLSDSAIKRSPIKFVEAEPETPQSLQMMEEADPFDLPTPKAKKVELPAEKKKVVEAAKEMIKKVESGIKEEVKPTPDEDWDSM